jgi:hypothetical protein
MRAGFEAFATAKERHRPRPGHRQEDRHEHGGRVSYESSAGQGTTFKVVLPRRCDALTTDTGEHKVVSA